jgi:hypothetical protein
MRRRRLERRLAERRRSGVQATRAASLLGAAAVDIVAIAGLGTPGERLQAGSEGAEQEQSQDEDDDTPMHAAPSVPDFLRPLPARTLYWVE